MTNTILSFVFSVALGLICIELFAFLIFKIKRGWNSNVQKSLRGELNDFNIQKTKSDNYKKSKVLDRTKTLEAYYPHPYLSYVVSESYSSVKRGQTHKANNFGLFSPDFPEQKDVKNFNILIVGGSVACQFAQMFQNGPKYLELHLNNNFECPKPGGRFVTFNGAMGGWKYPQQSILIMMAGSSFDLIISLDGFNEFTPGISAPGTRFESPGSKFHLLNPSAGGGYSFLLINFMVGKIFDFSLKSRIFSKSYSVYLAGLMLRKKLLKKANNQIQNSLAYRLFTVDMQKDKYQQLEYCANKYAEYLNMNVELSKILDAEYLGYFQPIPFISKTLTAEEKTLVGPDKKGYGERYPIFLGLTKKGLRSVSSFTDLRDVFQETLETVYRDNPHCLNEKDTGVSRGYEIMAHAISTDIATKLSLEMKG